jgi:hypothetical protein
MKSLCTFFKLMLKSINIFLMYFVDKPVDYDELVGTDAEDVTMEDANRILNKDDDMDTQQHTLPAAAPTVMKPAQAVHSSIDQQ